MNTATSPLILVQPADTIAAILARIKQTGAHQVQLLVPDGVTVLRGVVAAAELRLELRSAGVNALVLSPDPATLETVRKLHFETVLIGGTARAVPPRSAPAVSAASAAPVSVAPSVPPQQPTAPDVLDTLDDMPLGDPDQAPARAYTWDDDEPPPASEWEEPRVTPALHRRDDLELEDWDEAPPVRSRPIDEDELEPWDEQTDTFNSSRAELEDWDDDDQRQRGSSTIDDEVWELEESPPPRSRIQAALADARARGREEEDTAVLLDERDALVSVEEPYDRERRAERAAVSAERLLTGQRARRRPASARIERTEPRSAGPSVSLPLLLGAVLLIGVIAVGFGYLLNSRTTVTIYAPPSSVPPQPFSNEVIPLGGSNSSLRGLPLTAQVEAAGQGTATRRQVPVGVARGTVTIYNTERNPIDLPGGTEFIAANANGENISFVIDNPGSVPAATTRVTVDGSTTTNGKADIAISARQPGSGSNVGANAIQLVVPPGSQGYRTGGSLTIQHPALSGGTEEDVAIVSEDDVKTAVPAAIQKLRESAITQLTAQAGLNSVDQATINPSPQQLLETTDYEVAKIDPPIGQRPPDQNNPIFNILVRATFSALATPAGQPIEKQLQTVAPAYFQERGVLPPDCPPRVLVRGYRWDGTRLTIEGTLGCQPSLDLPASTLDAVRSAVTGKSREDAAAGLVQLQQQGIISGFDPITRASLPGLSPLIQLQVVAPPEGPTVQKANP